MTEAIQKAGTVVGELTSARSVQAVVTIIVTLALMFLVVSARPIPDFLLYAWFALLGLYMEMPGKI